MKKIIAIIFFLLFPLISFAADPGYYYGSGLAAGDYSNETGAYGTTSGAADAITIVTGGTITLVGTKTGEIESFECRIYKDDNTLLGCYQGTTVADTFTDATVSPGLTVSNSQVIYVQCTCLNIWTAYYAGDSGGFYDSSSWEYNDACSGNFDAGSDWEHAVRVYVAEAAAPPAGPSPADREGPVMSDWIIE